MNKKTWFRAHGIRVDEVCALPAAKQLEFHERFTHAWHRKLNECHGECVLRTDSCRAEVVSALRYFDQVRYSMGDFVIMPNHLHLLVTPDDGQDLEKLCFSWK